MTLFDDIRKVYPVSAKCKNCGVVNIIKIRKGISIQEFFSHVGGVCENCGCLIQFKKAKTVKDNGTEQE